jgi:diguanylate cyclase
MTKQPPTAPKTASQDLERLAEIIIETMKDLSGARQLFTPSTFSKALAPKREMIHQLTSSTSTQESVSLLKPDDASEQRVRDLEMRLKRALDHEPELESRLADLEGELSRVGDFLKRSTLSLIILANEKQDQAMSAQLERLRALMTSDAPLDTLEQCLGDLKTMIFKERAVDSASPSPDDSSSKAPSFWSTWRRRMEPGRRSDADEIDAGLLLMRKLLEAILDQFRAGSGLHHHSLEELRERIGNCGDMNGLAGIGEELALIIRNYLHTTTEEHRQIALFATELRGGFREMEALLLASLSDTQDTHRVNTAFDRTLSVQVDGIKESFSISKTIEEVRGLVYSKLQGIKSVLEEKRKQDEARMEQSNQKMSELQQHLQTMQEEIDQIQARTKSLEQEALSDSLTNTHNRRAYELRIDEEFQRYKRYSQLFSLVLFDVDHFKRVNDQYGHRAGDKVLREIINRIRPTLRKMDFLVRYGGEEFIVILPGTTSENAVHVAEKLRQLIEKTTFLFQGQKVPVTISLGVTEVRPSDLDTQMLFVRVDEAMYEAKREGRNRTAVR